MAVIVACVAGNETVAAVIVGVVCVFVPGVAVILAKHVSVGVVASRVAVAAILTVTYLP